MHPDFSKLQQELTAGVSGLTATQTQLRPNGHPEKWSIQQIADHLRRTYAVTAEAFHIRIEKRAPTKALPSLRQRLGQFMITTLGRFPGGYVAPLQVAPPETAERLSGDELAHAMAMEIGRMDGLASQAEALFGSRRAISHMVLGPLSVGQWRRFHLAHARHHLKQIVAIRRNHLL